MPSRITRNSHRPRASDRTMVAMKHHLACRSLKLDGSVTISGETQRMDNKPNFSREVRLQWAGSRETISTPVETELFFLTSLFIELIVGFTENVRHSLGDW